MPAWVGPEHVRDAQQKTEALADQAHVRFILLELELTRKEGYYACRAIHHLLDHDDNLPATRSNSSTTVLFLFFCIDLLSVGFVVQSCPNNAIILYAIMQHRLFKPDHPRIALQSNGTLLPY